MVPSFRRAKWIALHGVRQRMGGDKSYCIEMPLTVLPTLGISWKLTGPCHDLFIFSILEFSVVITQSLGRAIIRPNNAKFSFFPQWLVLLFVILHE
jgi:hypothetical protein